MIKYGVWYGNACNAVQWWDTKEDAEAHLKRLSAEFPLLASRLRVEAADGWPES